MNNPNTLNESALTSSLIAEYWYSRHSDELERSLLIRYVLIRNKNFLLLIRIIFIFLSKCTYNCVDPNDQGMQGFLQDPFLLHPLGRVT